MNQFPFSRRAVRFSATALALGIGIALSPISFAGEPPAKLSPPAAAPGEQGTGATITFDNLQLELVVDPAAQPPGGAKTQPGGVTGTVKLGGKDVPVWDGGVHDPRSDVLSDAMSGKPFKVEFVDDKIMVNGEVVPAEVVQKLIRARMNAQRNADGKQPAEKGKDAQFFINGKVVSPEDAGKIPPGAKVVALPDGKVLIVPDAKDGAPSEKATAPANARFMTLPDGKVLIVNDSGKETKGNEAKTAEWTAATPVEGQGKFIINFTAKVSDYYLGLECFPADEALRTQLNLPEHQGLIVEQVVPDSPAAKAEIKRFDVLMSANDKKLGDVSDLTPLVDEGKEIRFGLLRGGKKQAISVTPAKRPKPEGGEPNSSTGVLKVVPSTQDQKALEEGLKFLIKSQPGGDDGKGNVMFRVVGPGVAVPPTAKFNELPDDMSITITRKGKGPAHIAVRQGDEKWEATEKDLDKLPEKIRGWVGPLVNRFDLMRFRSPEAAADLLNSYRMDGPESGGKSAEGKKAELHNVIIKAEAVPADGQPGMNKGLEAAINKRFEFMQREIEELRHSNGGIITAIHEATAAMGHQIAEVRDEARAGGDKRAEEFRQREQQIRQEYEQKIRELKQSIDKGASKHQDSEKPAK